MFHVTEWPGRLVGCAVTSLDREPFSNTHKHTLKYICSLFLPYVSSLRTLHRRTFTCRHSQRPSPCSPSIAIERSISHFTASYTFLCHSQLLLHSNGRLAQQRRPRGSSPSLLLTHTSQTHTNSAGRASCGAAWSLTSALCLSVSQPLGPEDTFSQRGWLPERRDSHSSEILIPGARQPSDLAVTFLAEEGMRLEFYLNFQTSWRARALGARS